MSDGLGHGSYQISYDGYTWSDHSTADNSHYSGWYYNGGDKVTVEDISQIITLCLRHRLRKDPLESIDSGNKVGKIFAEIFEIED